MIKGGKGVRGDGVIEGDIVVEKGVIGEIGCEIEGRGREMMQGEGK